MSMEPEFVESIKIKDGKAVGVSYHQARMSRTIQHLFPEKPIPNLEEALSPTPAMHFHKARVIYNAQGINDIQYTPYAMRKINSLKIIKDDNICYPFKSTDRSRLNMLSAKKEECDEIIIMKQGLVTDTSFTNIAILEGRKWITPRHPLLPGTKRAYLLEAGLMEEADITFCRLMKAEKVCLFNAMIELSEITLTPLDIST